MEHYQIDHIKSNTDILALVAERARKSSFGNNFHCCLPGHNDQHPSLSVSPSKGLFYCHGCGRGGDAFTFIQKMDGLTFLQAVEYLANRLGIHWEKKRLTDDEMRLLKQKTQARKERVALFGELEGLQKAVESDLYDVLRQSRYQLPHHRQDVVFLDNRIYRRGLIEEEMLDQTFDDLDQVVADRKRYFQEARNAIRRS